MSNQARIEVFTQALSRSGRVVDFPRKSDGRPQSVSEIFGENVFSRNEMSKMLPKPVFKTFIEQSKKGGILDSNTTDAIAHAVKVWALERGATHFTHWFQPLNDSTAEKHDSFLTLKTTYSSGFEQVTALDTLSGSQLLQSEPDASSFPSGGMRTTFEARGYTVWDTKSPMFIQEGPHGTAILYIPSVFISYNGEALDEKSVLLRSTVALESAALEVLALIEPKNDEEKPRTKQVFTTLGTEQEYFLIDRSLYSLRPDLKITGRTLVGSLPPRHQQLEDHYFGKIPTRVLAAISEAELELAKLGVPVKTRHNEVAPAQFEIAPIFEEAMLAVDHNMLTMDVLHRVAHRHKLKVLFHEKPFQGVNGSGKHCNWSMSTDRGENLLEPTAHPEKNLRFLLFLVAVLHGVHQHSALLRIGISSASNDHRLGGHEAPPGIISAFLGSQLNGVLDAIEKGEEKSVQQDITEYKRVQLGTVLDLKVAALPAIARDLTDRNRTSPFAFTGNKFEFRAVGSKQSVSFPMTLLNSAVASALHDIRAALKAQMGDKPVASDEDQMAVVRSFITKTKNIRFEGDNYSEEWREEAGRRGLPIIESSPDAFEKLTDDIHKKMLIDLDVFTAEEIASRQEILFTKYARDIEIEAQTMVTMLRQQVLPAALSYRGELAQSAMALKTISAGYGPELQILEDIEGAVSELQTHILELTKLIREPLNAQKAKEQVLPKLKELRELADHLENTVADKNWPLPKYAELFWNI